MGVCIARCWSSLKSGMSAEEIHGANELMLERQEAEFGTLKRLEGLVSAAEGTFLGAASAKELDPSATGDALNAENEAAENAQVSGQFDILGRGAFLERKRAPQSPRCAGSIC